MKKVLILGGTSDIGKHIVYGFGKRGYDIIVTGRDNKRLNEIKEYTIKNYNIKIQDYILDVEKFNSHEDFLNSLDDLPEITVCCFGYYEDQDEAFNKFEEALRTINVNYSGAVSLINRISKRYMEKKNGSIVVLSSVAGIRGRQKNYLYGSTKAALSTYLSGLRNYLYNYNISVTNILLGPVYTRMSEGHNLMPVLTAKPEDAAEKIIKAGLNKKDEVYILWYWKVVMFIIKIIPEFIFKRLGPF